MPFPWHLSVIQAAIEAYPGRIHPAFRGFPNLFRWHSGRSGRELFEDDPRTESNFVPIHPKTEEVAKEWQSQNPKLEINSVTR